MLSITNTAKADIYVLDDLIKKWDKEGPQNDFLIIDLIQNIIRNAALISKFLWPSEKKSYYTKRGESLRNILEITEPNVLQDKNVRNSLEHFDEKLDDYLFKCVAGNIMLSYVGSRPANEIIYHFFRAYYIYECVFKILDKEIDINPIIDELMMINDKLEEWSK